MASFVSYSVIGLLILVCCVGSIRTATILPDTLDVDSDNLFNYTSCEDVRQVFVDTNIGSAKDTTDMSHEGTLF